LRLGHPCARSTVEAALADESPAMNKVIVNNPDDRLNSIPVNWWTFSHESPQDVTNTISVRNASIIDIFVEQVSPSFAFTVTYVENSGPLCERLVLVFWHRRGGARECDFHHQRPLPRRCRR
jgi:hypothetical protein